MIFGHFEIMYQTTPLNFSGIFFFFTSRFRTIACRRYRDSQVRITPLILTIWILFCDEPLTFLSLHSVIIFVVFSPPFFKRLSLEGRIKRLIFLEYYISYYKAKIRWRHTVMSFEKLRSKTRLKPGHKSTKDQTRKECPAKVRYDHEHTYIVHGCIYTPKNALRVFF